jgi:hypothetical protein
MNVGAVEGPTDAPTNAACVKKVLANTEPSTHEGKPALLADAAGVKMTRPVPLICRQPFFKRNKSRTAELGLGCHGSGAAMQSNTCRQHAQTCFRLAIDAGDPEISQQLIAIAGEWLAEAAQTELENLECAMASQFAELGAPIANKH